MLAVDTYSLAVRDKEDEKEKSLPAGGGTGNISTRIEYTPSSSGAGQVVL
jgi:hypothetical protein